MRFVGLRDAPPASSGVVTFLFRAYPTPAEAERATREADARGEILMECCALTVRGMCVNDLVVFETPPRLCVRTWTGIAQFSVLRPVGGGVRVRMRWRGCDVETAPTTRAVGPKPSHLDLVVGALVRGVDAADARPAATLACMRSAVV